MLGSISLLRLEDAFVGIPERIKRDINKLRFVFQHNLYNTTQLLISGECFSKFLPGINCFVYNGVELV